MPTVTLEEAQALLPQLIERLRPGEEILITRNEKPFARLTSEPPHPSTRQLGTMAGSVTFMAEDFDAPLEEFAEYMR